MKPREWWVSEDLLDPGYGSAFLREPPIIHVVEKSAYNALKASCDELATALEVYAITNDTFPEYGAVAKEALAKHEARMKELER